jgi:hypothetical protein
LIGECDKEIEKQLIEQVASKNGSVIADIPEMARKASYKQKLPFNATTYLKAIYVVDVTAIFRIGELCVHLRFCLKSVQTCENGKTNAILSPGLELLPIQRKLQVK